MNSQYLEIEHGGLLKFKNKVDDRTLWRKVSAIMEESKMLKPTQDSATLVAIRMTKALKSIAPLAWEAERIRAVGTIEDGKIIVRWVEVED